MTVKIEPMFVETERQKQDRFLWQVTAFCEAHPEMAPRVVDAASMGVVMSIRQSREMLADVETCLAMVLANSSKNLHVSDPGLSAMLIQMMGKHKEKTTVPFSFYVDRLSPSCVAPPKELKNKDDADEAG